MALHEGCRRLRKAGKLLILFGLVVALLGTLLLGVGYGFQILNVGPLVPLLLMVVFFTLVVGGQLWFIGWIIEGFASPQATDSERGANSATR